MHSIAHIKAWYYACKADMLLRRFIDSIIFSSVTTTLHEPTMSRELISFLPCTIYRQTLECPDDCQSKVCGTIYCLARIVSWAYAHTSPSTSATLRISCGFSSLLLKTLLLLFFQMYHNIHGKLLKSYSFGNRQKR